MRIVWYIFLGICCGTAVCAPGPENYDPESVTRSLHEFARPWTLGDAGELIEFTFEGAELSKLIEYMAFRFDVTFIMDDVLNPLPQGGKSIMGSKVSLRTNKPLTKQEAWSLFVTLLDSAGIAIIPGPSPRMYRLTNSDPKSPLAPGKQALPFFVGTSVNELPEDDGFVRYLLFVRNTSLDSVISVINELKSPQSPKVIVIPDLRAILLTEKSSLLKAILEVVTELDQESGSEVMKILYLERIDAARAVALYKELIKTEEPTLTAKLMGQRKKPNSQFLPDLVRLVPVAHLNAVIILGTRDSVDKAYDFLQKTLDRKSFVNHKPIFVYDLKHLRADEIARILNTTTKFQMDTDAAKSGGIRDGDKYFKPMTIEAENSGNRLIINADYDDYKNVLNLLQKIDIEQPQVAMQILILNVSIDNEKELGTQLRNKVDGAFNQLLGKNVNFQTSGLAGTGSSVVENTTLSGAQRLLGDLISLASLTGNAASTLVTLGQDLYGVWGMFKALETYQKLSIIDNPFIVTTNKYPAKISLGEIRRVTDSVVEGQSTVNALKDLSARLEVSITPQVSKDGLITLDFNVLLEEFAGSPTDTTTNGNRISRNLQTSAVVANNEVLALGGLVRDIVVETVSRVPVLGYFPVIGPLFFSNTAQSVIRSSLLILVIPKIIMPGNTEVTATLTERKVRETRSTLNDFFHQRRDPLLRWFFGNATSAQDQQMVDNFMAEDERYIDESKKRALPVLPSHHSVASMITAPTKPER
jgi:general secretion pathway protein D